MFNMSIQKSKKKRFLKSKICLNYFHGQTFEKLIYMYYICFFTTGSYGSGSSRDCNAVTTRVLHVGRVALSEKPTSSHCMAAHTRESMILVIFVDLADCEPLARYERELLPNNPSYLQEYTTCFTQLNDVYKLK